MLLRPRLKDFWPVILLILAAFIVALTSGCASATSPAARDFKSNPVNIGVFKQNNDPIAGFHSQEGLGTNGLIHSIRDINVEIEYKATSETQTGEIGGDAEGGESDLEVPLR